MNITEPNHMWQYLYKDNMSYNFDPEKHIVCLCLCVPGTVLGNEVTGIHVFLTVEFHAADILQVHTLPDIVEAWPISHHLDSHGFQ